jgi:hypothetical protein
LVEGAEMFWEDLYYIGEKYWYALFEEFRSDFSFDLFFNFQLTVHLNFYADSYIKNVMSLEIIAHLV